MNSSTENTGIDVVVIGAGPGGYTAAFRASDLGLKTILVEKHETLGGVCLNVGCIPSKALLHVAHIIDQAQELSAHGVTFSKPTISPEAICDWKNSVIKGLTSGLARMAKQRGIEVIKGTAKFKGQNKLAISADEKQRNITFKKAIIATGSSSATLPFLPNDPRIITSTGALNLTDIPKRLLVIGGGIIGMEMATVYNALGSNVTVVELTDSIIPGCDPALVRPLKKRIKKSYDKVLTSTAVTKVEATPKGLVAYFDGKDALEKETFDKILVAVGRRPNSSNLDIEKAGVTVDEHGFIPVDSQQKTNIENIYAIGDVTLGPMLAHKASAEGKVAAEVAAGMKTEFGNRVIPSVAYTDPEIAWVGMTETQAKKQGTSIGIGKFPWAASGRSLSMGRSDGLTTLLFDKESKRLLGAGFVGPGASELVAEATLAIEMGADAEDIGLTIHPHPTLSESLAMAAEAYEGTITDLYIPRKKTS